MEYHKELRRNKYTKKYGTNFDYKKLLRSQKFRCAICKHRVNEQIGEVLHIDHDHNCRYIEKGWCRPPKKLCGHCVRGLLCRSCNTALGLFKDSKSIVEKAVEYLSDWDLHLLITDKDTPNEFLPDDYERGDEDKGW